MIFRVQYQLWREPKWLIWGQKLSQSDQEYRGFFAYFALNSVAYPPVNTIFSEHYLQTKFMKRTFTKTFDKVPTLALQVVLKTKRISFKHATLSSVIEWRNYSRWTEQAIDDQYSVVETRKKWTQHMEKWSNK